MPIQGMPQHLGPRARELSISEFLAMHEHALSVIRTNPEKLPVDIKVDDSVQFLQELIRHIGLSVAKGAKNVIILDDTTCPDIYPCPRFMSARRPPTADELAHDPGVSEVIPETFVGWDEALRNLYSGAWQANVLEIRGLDFKAC